MDLRYYQRDCLKAINEHLFTQKTNPLCVLATGTGKSVIIGQFIKNFIQQYPKTRIICCIDTKELVEQNYLKLLELWKTAPAGVYSAGLKARDTKHQILFTGIQSIYNKADLIGRRDILIIDETHMANTNEGSMWDIFIKQLRPTRILGFTATPHRNDCGLIYTSDEAIYKGITYEYTIKQGLKDKYLCELIPRKMATEFDVTNVKKSNGDFNESELQEVINQESLNEQVINEIIQYGKNRKGWLLFSAGCDHAKQLDLLLKNKGYKGGVILGDTPQTERDELIKAFKNQEIRYLINNAVLTKGFDAPHIDLIAAIRPTISPVLWAQMIGRGFRLHDSKDNCLLLDFAGNIFRFGYVDEMIFSDKKNNNQEQPPPVKTCPECESIMPAATRICKVCEHEFEIEENGTSFDGKSYNGAILSTQVMPQWVDIENVWYSKHKSKKGVYLLKVEYITKNYERYYDWVCLEHTGYARQQALKWWRANTDFNLIKDEKTVLFAKDNRFHIDIVPTNVDDALKVQDAIIKPSRLKVIEDGQFWEVLKRDNSQPNEQIDNSLLPDNNAYLEENF